MGHPTPADERYFARALSLARKGQGNVFPNPMVGAVIVRGGRIVGEGYHRKAGGPHAEIEALRKAGRQSKGATLYLNLEPCSHFGKTPPCADAVIAAGIRKVFCIMRDPNPRVSGKGFRRLRKAGIEVVVDGPVAQAESLNEGFFAFHRRKRPFVTIKFATSLDGKIATRTGDSKWITGEDARAHARTLRGESQAILVGINTVLADDPHLGIREKGKKDPLRIILDSRLRIPPAARILRDANVLVVTTKFANANKKRSLVEKGIGILEMGNRIDVTTLMRELYRREIISVLVEGGERVLGSFVDARCVDKIHAFHAPLLIGGETAKSAVGGKGAASIRQALHLTRIERKIFGDTVLVSGYIKR